MSDTYMIFNLLHSIKQVYSKWNTTKVIIDEYV